MEQAVLLDQKDLNSVTELAARFPTTGPMKQHGGSIQLYVLLQTKPSNYSMTLSFKVLQSQARACFPSVFPLLFHVLTIFF